MPPGTYYLYRSVARHLRASGWRFLTFHKTLRIWTEDERWLAFEVHRRDVHGAEGFREAEDLDVVDIAYVREISKVIDVPLDDFEVANE